MKPATGFAGFIARLLSNDGRNLFMVRLGSQLILAKFGLVGFAGTIAGFFLRGFLGLLIEDGTFVIDLGLDAYREGQKLEDFKKEAAAAYAKTTAKVYDERKKDEIRQQYLKIISAIGTVGNGPRP